MKKISVFINDYNYFISHKIKLFEYLSSKYKVYIFCPLKNQKKLFKTKKLIFINISINRGIISYIDFVSFLKYFFLIKRLNPDLVHCFTLKPIIISLLSSFFLKKNNLLFNFSGFGIFLVSQKLLYKLIWKIILFLFKIIKSNNFYYLFQNSNQKSLFENSTYISPSRLFLIESSGVDTNYFKKKTSIEKEPEFSVMFSGRLLKSKGLLDLLDAAMLLRDYPIIFKILGDFDENNSDSLNERDLINYKKNNKIIFYGHQSNIKDFYNNTSVFCFPSYYGEGIAKCLIEALSMSLPIITTDWPGCKETVTENYNGILVNIKKPSEIKKAILSLYNDKKLIETYSINSRKIAEIKYDLSNINYQTSEKYKLILRKNK